MAKRGSELLSKRCKPFPDDVLTRLGSLVDEHGGELIGWECVGQPQPEAVAGVARARDLDVTLDILRDILELEPRFRFEVFPRGIPAPDWFELEFRTPGMGR